MITGPKYKIARRLGAPIFEKTQTQKYALRQERKGKKQGFSKPKSEYGIQLNEKQKARFIYGMTERQFRNYVREAIAKKGATAVQSIFEFLELRLDNAVYRLGFAPTRLAAKQMVSHGHLMVNGKRATTPSMRLSMGDKISLRPSSAAKPLFANLDDRLKNVTVPSWLKLDASAKIAEVQGMPLYVQTDNMFDLNAVVEFYSRS